MMFLWGQRYLLGQVVIKRHGSVTRCIDVNLMLMIRWQVVGSLCRRKAGPNPGSERRSRPLICSYLFDFLRMLARCLVLLAIDYCPYLSVAMKYNKGARGVSGSVDDRLVAETEAEAEPKLPTSGS